MNEIEKGKSVRGGKLVPNTRYVMRIWGKPPTFTYAWFLGAGTSLATVAAPEGQLKAQPDGIIFYFKIDDKVTEILPGLGWLGFPNSNGEPDTSKRVTFFLPLTEVEVEPEPDTEVKPEEIVQALEETIAQVPEEQLTEEDNVAEHTVELEEPTVSEDVEEIPDDQPEASEIVLRYEDDTVTVSEDEAGQKVHNIEDNTYNVESDDQPEIDLADVVTDDTLEEVTSSNDGDESSAQRKARLKRERRAARKQSESIEG